MTISGSMLIYQRVTGWWFQTFFIFHNIWDNPSHWLQYFSRWLKPPTRCVYRCANIYIYMYMYAISPQPKLWPDSRQKNHFPGPIFGVPIHNSKEGLLSTGVRWSSRYRRHSHYCSFQQTVYWFSWTGIMKTHNMSIIIIWTRYTYRDI